MASLSQRRSGARNGARAAEQSISTELARQARVAAEEADAGRARRKAAREAEAARVKFTAADLAEASHVRDSIGWHWVVRVSAKSVTVKSPHSWDERIPIDRVLQYAVNGKAVAR